MSKNELRSSGEPRSGGFANGACEMLQLIKEIFIKPKLRSYKRNVKIRV